MKDNIISVIWKNGSTGKIQISLGKKDNKTKSGHWQKKQTNIHRQRVKTSISPKRKEKKEHFFVFFHTSLPPQTIPLPRSSYFHPSLSFSTTRFSPFYDQCHDQPTLSIPHRRFPPLPEHPGVYSHPSRSAGVPVTLLCPRRLHTGSGGGNRHGVSGEVGKGLADVSQRYQNRADYGDYVIQRNMHVRGRSSFACPFVPRLFHVTADYGYAWPALSPFLSLSLSFTLSLSDSPH